MATELLIWIADRQVSAANGGAPRGDVSWRALPASTNTLAPDALAEAIAAATAETGRGTRGATLVLPSSWCYVQRFGVAVRRPARVVLAYALEEYLPVEVEQLTCDFIHMANGDHLGIAVETARMRSLLDALARQGFCAEHITLDVLEAAHWVDDGGTLLWCDDEHVAVLERNQRGWAGLRVVRLAPDLTDEKWCRRVAGHLAGAIEEPLTVAGCVGPERLSALAALLPKATAAGSESSSLHRSVASSFPTVNLARGALACATQQTGLLRVWRRAAVVTLVALLAVCAAFQVHRMRVESRLQSITAWERAVFVELFPGQTPPAGVALRLASERQRLEGLTHVEGGAPTRSADALDCLRSIVAALPRDVRLDLQELRLEGADVTLRGDLRDHRQAEQITAALGKVKGLECTPPRTQRLPAGGVQFFIHARRLFPGATDQAAAPAGPGAGAAPATRALFVRKGAAHNVEEHP